MDNLISCQKCDALGYIDRYNPKTNMLEIRCSMCGYEWTNPAADNTPPKPTAKEKCRMAWESIADNRETILAAIFLGALILLAIIGCISLVGLVTP